MGRNARQNAVLNEKAAILGLVTIGLRTRDFVAASKKTAAIAAAVPVFNALELEQ